MAYCLLSALFLSPENKWPHNQTHIVNFVFFFKLNNILPLKMFQRVIVKVKMCVQCVFTISESKVKNKLHFILSTFKHNVQ